VCRISFCCVSKEREVKNQNNFFFFNFVLLEPSSLCPASSSYDDGGNLRGGGGGKLFFICMGNNTSGALGRKLGRVGNGEGGRSRSLSWLSTNLISFVD